jgi:hypothetical protein
MLYESKDCPKYIESTHVFAENEQEFEKASPEVELHGHSVGAASKPSVFPKHSFAFSEDTCGLFGPMTGSTSGACTPPHRPDKALVEVEDDDSESFDEDEAQGFGIHQHKVPNAARPFPPRFFPVGLLPAGSFLAGLLPARPVPVGLYPPRSFLAGQLPARTFLVKPLLA